MYNLEERIFAEVRIMLEEGDIHYLMRFNRAGLMEALEQELGFLGLYHRDDRETPAAIHALLEEKLDQWCEYYLRPRTVKVQREASPLIQNTSSAVAGIVKTKRTQY